MVAGDKDSKLFKSRFADKTPTSASMLTAPLFQGLPSPPTPLFPGVSVVVDDVMAWGGKADREKQSSLNASNRCMSVIFD